jgi:hypothetical protein
MPIAGCSPRFRDRRDSGIVCGRSHGTDTERFSTTASLRDSCAAWHVTVAGKTLRFAHTVTSLCLPRAHDHRLCLGDDHYRDRYARNVAPPGKQRRTPRHGRQSPDRTYHRDTGGQTLPERRRRDGVTKCGCRIRRYRCPMGCRWQAASRRRSACGTRRRCSHSGQAPCRQARCPSVANA